MSLLPDAIMGFNCSDPPAMAPGMMLAQFLGRATGIYHDHYIECPGEPQSYCHASEKTGEHNGKNAAHDHRQSDDQGQNLRLGPPYIYVFIRLHLSDPDRGSTPYVQWL